MSVRKLVTASPTVTGSAVSRNSANHAPTPAIATTPMTPAAMSPARLTRASVPRPPRGARSDLESGEKIVLDEGLTVRPPAVRR